MTLIDYETRVETVEGQLLEVEDIANCFMVGRGANLRDIYFGIYTQDDVTYFIECDQASFIKVHNYEYKSQKVIKEIQSFCSRSTESPVIMITPEEFYNSLKEFYSFHLVMPAKFNKNVDNQDE